MTNPHKHVFGSKSTADDVLAGLNLKGQTILVTGCNSGIGFETMRALAARGAHVLAMGRNMGTAQAACSRTKGDATPIACDQGDLTSVAAAIEAVRNTRCTLDAIVANAGIMAPAKLQTRYGIEMQFLINHISHFALVTRLLDRVAEGSGRIVIVSSRASVDFAPPEGIMFDNLGGQRFYKPWSFYGQSKLANALFAKELSIRLTTRRIVANSLHPGDVAGTQLTRNLGLLKWILPIANLFMKNIAQGAATQTFLASSPAVTGITGEYFRDCQVSKGHALLEDREVARRLWDVSEEIVAKSAPCGPHSK